jgi:hypothetical protein
VRASHEFDPESELFQLRFIGHKANAEGREHDGGSFLPAPQPMGQGSDDRGLPN